MGFVKNSIRLEHGFFWCSTSLRLSESVLLGPLRWIFIIVHDVQLVLGGRFSFRADWRDLQWESEISLLEPQGARLLILVLRFCAGTWRTRILATLQMGCKHIRSK